MPNAQQVEAARRRRSALNRPDKGPDPYTTDFPDGADPIAVMFGEDSHAELLQQEKDDQNIPGEIQELFEHYGLSKRKFGVTLKSVPDGVNSNQAGYIAGWDRKIPTVDYIAHNWGPGEYQLLLSWRGVDSETKKTRNFLESVYMTVDEKFRDKWEQILLERQIKQAEKQRGVVQKAQLKKQLTSGLLDDGKGGNGRELALSYVNEVSELAEKMGWKPNQGSGLGDILKAAIPFIPAVVTFLNNQATAAREREERFLTMLMSMNNNSNSQLIEVLKQQQPKDGAEMMKKFTEMVMGAIDLKEAIHGEKESIVDKIVSVVSSVAPVVLGMANMSKQARESNPAYQAARKYVDNDPAFQQMHDNPEVLAGVVNKLDDFYGWQQTDGILSVAGMERPQSCPREHEKQRPVNERTGRMDAAESSDENVLQEAAG